MKRSFLLLFNLVFLIPAQAQPGTLDISFGNAGFITTQIGTGNSGANAVTVQPDSKILAAGSASNNGQNDFALVRYRADGSIDTDFNLNGKAYVDFNGLSDYCTSMVQQPDQKILMAGFTEGATGFDLALARLDVSGTIDTTFGKAGKVTASIGLSFFGNAVALQVDGKILVAGYAFSMTNVFAVMRFLADGTPDMEFGNQGIVMAAIGNGPSIATSMAVQTDGKIILTGHTFNDSLWRWEAAILRLNPDGTPDADFGNSGSVITPIAGTNITMNAITLQPDGKIILAGYNGNSPSTNKFTLMRYLPAGSLDEDFADHGILISAVGPLGNQAESVLLQGDRIYVGGSLQQGNGDHFALACYHQNGAIDTTFGNQGITITNGSNEGINALALQVDGKILAAGISFNGTRSDFILSRFHTQLSLSVPSIEKAGHSIAVFPNPVQENSRLQFNLAHNETISVYLYNTLGIKISTLVDSESKTAGRHEILLRQATTLTAGTYFVILFTSEGNKSFKIIK